MVGGGGVWWRRFVGWEFVGAGERDSFVRLWGMGVAAGAGGFSIAVLVVDDCLKSRLSRAVGCCFLLLFCVTLSACGAFAKQQPILLVHVWDPDPVLSASMQIVRLSESSAPANRAIITTNASRDLLLIEI
jgi:hypothetical protein